MCYRKFECANTNTNMYAYWQHKRKKSNHPSANSNSKHTREMTIVNEDLMVNKTTWKVKSQK